jgi:hypothetical protein
MQETEVYEWIIAAEAHASPLLHCIELALY